MPASPWGGAKELCPPFPLTQLPGAAAEDLVKCRKEAPMKSPAKALTSIGDTVKFEVYWRPGQDQFALNAKVSVGR